MSENSTAKIQYRGLFPSNFWDRPKVKARLIGDVSEAPLYLAVGAALTTWEITEEIFAHLFSIFSQAGGPVTDMSSMLAVTRVFGAIENTNGRLAAFEAVAEVYFGEYWHFPEVKKPVQRLINEIKFASWRRNDIAHGKVIRLQVHGEEGENSVRHLGCLLVAPTYMTGRTSLFADFSEEDKFAFTKSLYRFNSNDILSYKNKFEALRLKMIDYIQTIYKDPQTRIPKIVLDLQLNVPKAFSRKIPP